MTPLRQRMTEDMRVRNFSPVTIKLYIDAVAKFAKFFHKSPALLGPDEVRTYQVYLIHEKKASWSAFNIAVSALRVSSAIPCHARHRSLPHRLPGRTYRPVRLLRQGA